MDGERFDDLARRWAGVGGSRRALARLVVGGGVAAGLARLGLDGAAARCVAPGNRCRPGEACCGGARCRRDRCKCPPHRLACGRECVDTSDDPDNCNGCGNVCPGGGCEFGQCCTAVRQPCESLQACCSREGTASCRTISNNKGGAFGCGFFGNFTRCCIFPGFSGCTGDCDCCGDARCQNGTCV